MKFRCYLVLLGGNRTPLIIKFKYSSTSNCIAESRIPPVLYQNNRSRNKGAVVIFCYCDMSDAGRRIVVFIYHHRRRRCDRSWRWITYICFVLLIRLLSLSSGVSWIASVEYDSRRSLFNNFHVRTNIQSRKEGSMHTEVQINSTINLVASSDHIITININSHTFAAIISKNIHILLIQQI